MKRRASTSRWSAWARVRPGRRCGRRGGRSASFAAIAAGRGVSGRIESSKRPRPAVPASTPDVGVAYSGAGRGLPVASRGRLLSVALFEENTSAGCSGAASSSSSPGRSFLAARLSPGALLVPPALIGADRTTGRRRPDWPITLRATTGRPTCAPESACPGPTRPILDWGCDGSPRSPRWSPYFAAPADLRRAVLTIFETGRARQRPRTAEPVLYEASDDPDVVGTDTKRHPAVCDDPSGRLTVFVWPRRRRFTSRLLPALAPRGPGPTRPFRRVFHLGQPVAIGSKGGAAGLRERAPGQRDHRARGGRRAPRGGVCPVRTPSLTPFLEMGRC